jgi:signal transduction histidine kinase
VFEDPEGIKARFDKFSRENKSGYKETASQRWPQVRELEIYSTPVTNSEGETLGHLYVFRDITHEKEVERLKSEFVSLVTHELRTPLTSIVGYIELLLDGDAGQLQDEQTEFIRIIKKNADRLTLLVGDLLDVSRIEAGAIKLKISELDLLSLIQEVAQSLRHQIESKNQKLQINAPGELPVVQGDPTRITQIITNLLSNAHKYTHAGGSIWLSVSPEERRVRVAIRDTGIGISKNDQEKLFTKFFRAEHQDSDMVPGTGLGLWISRSLVEMQGGTMEVLSEPGKGSNFSFTLPLLA